jgi:2TM domain
LRLRIATAASSASRRAGRLGELDGPEMKMATAETDDDLRRRAERRVASRNGFRIHLAVYVLVNLLLWAIWASTGADVKTPWPIFASLGWGVGVAAHWWAVFGHNEDGREDQIQREMEKLRQRPR